MKNVPIATGFAVITVAQLVSGMYVTIVAARRGGEVRHLDHGGHTHTDCGNSSCVAQVLPPIPLDAYRLCIYSQVDRATEVAYTSLSLFYGM
jgi:hypothetical protein